MKRLLLTLMAVIFGAGATPAQEIQGREIDAQDVAEVLKATGHHLYSFDLSQLSNSTYEISVYCNEYGVEKPDNKNFPLGVNRRFATDYPKEEWADIQKEFKLRSVSDPFLVAKKMSVSIVPYNDSLVTLNVNLVEGGRLGIKLKMKALDVNGKSRFVYNSRPFVISEFKSGADIPLVLFGSSWFDEKHMMIRFCGEKKIAPDLSSEICENLPHYYVIGIRMTKKEDSEK